MGKTRNPDRVVGGQDDYIEANAIETKVLPTNGLTVLDFPKQEGQRRVVGRAKVSRRPHVDSIAGDLFVALMNEARRLRDKAQEGALSPSDMMALNKAIDGLSKLSREMREKDKQEAIEDLTDEELLLQTQELAKKLGEG